MSLDEKLTAALAAVAARWGTCPRSGNSVFEAGQCHTLAMALYHLCDALGGGQVVAAMNVSIDEDGTEFARGYSHMMFEDASGVLWDINGPDADERWVEMFERDTPDKWGMTTRIDWEQVPCDCPQFSDTQAWVAAHAGVTDTELLTQVIGVLSTYLKQ